MNPETGSFTEWPAFTDPAGRFALLYPPDWSILNVEPDRTVFQAPGRLTEFSVGFSGRDCEAARAQARARRLNYFLVREFTRHISGQDAVALEFRDTVSNRRDFRAFVPVQGRCCELQWARSEQSEGQKFEPA